MFPPTGLATAKAAKAATAYTDHPPAQHPLGGRQQEQGGRGEQGHPDEGREDERLLAAARKGERQRAERAERRKRDQRAAAPITGQRHGDARERQEEAGDRAAANGEHGEPGGKQRTPSLEGEQRPQSDRDPEGEGEAAGEQHRRGARPEPEASQGARGRRVHDGRGRRTARRPPPRPGRQRAAGRAPPRAAGTGRCSRAGSGPRTSRCSRAGSRAMRTGRSGSSAPRDRRWRAPGSGTRSRGRRPRACGGLAYGGGRSDRHSGPGRELRPLLERGAGLLRELCRDRLGVPGGGPDPVAGATARSGARLGERAPRRLSRVPSLGERHRGLVPGRRRHERHPPRPRRRRVEDRLGQAQRGALLLPHDHLVVRRAEPVRHRDRAAGAAVRDHAGAAAPRAAPPAPARLRDHLLGRPSGGADADPDRDRDRRGGAGRDSSPATSSPSGSGSSRAWRSSGSRPDTCARSRPGRGSGGCAGSPRSGSSSRPSTSAARSRTCCW